MLKNGYDEDFAKRCFTKLKVLVHTAFLKVMLLALHYWSMQALGLNFIIHKYLHAPYSILNLWVLRTAQIIRDAKEHNVTVNPVCINHSFWDNTLEPDGIGGHAVRLGFRQIKGMKEEDAIWINTTRGNGYSSVHDVWRRAGISPNLLAHLAEADVFSSWVFSPQSSVGGKSYKVS